jgi:hypothetical protein
MFKTFASTLMVAALLAGCANGKSDRQVEQELNNGGSRYTSAQVNGAKSRINLDAVKQAFWDTQGNDMDTAMQNFEKRVNEIYQGDEIVSIDASKQGTGVTVVGFIDKNQQPGFQSGDDRLFTIEQTGQAANNQVPYRMTYGDNNVPYYQGVQPYHSDHSGFWTGFLLGHIVGGWGHYGGHYYTPYTHYHTITQYRTVYRTTPAYQTQINTNRSFNTRFARTAPGGGVASTRKFGGFSNGSNGTGGSTSTRKWGGGPFGGGSSSSSSSTGSKPTSSFSNWSGRRPSGSSTTSGSSSSSTRSWGSSGSSSRSSSGSSSSSWSSRRSSSSSSSSRRRR